MGHRDLLVTHKLSEAENQDCRYHPRGSVRRASGFVLTGDPEVSGGYPTSELRIIWLSRCGRIMLNRASPSGPWA